MTNNYSKKTGELTPEEREQYILFLNLVERGLRETLDLVKTLKHVKDHYDNQFPNIPLPNDGEELDKAYSLARKIAEVPRMTLSRRLKDLKNESTGHESATPSRAGGRLQKMRKPTFQWGPQ